MHKTSRITFQDLLQAQKNGNSLNFSILCHQCRAPTPLLNDGDFRPSCHVLALFHVTTGILTILSTSFFSKYDFLLRLPDQTSGPKDKFNGGQKRAKSRDHQDLVSELAKRWTKELAEAGIKVEGTLALQSSRSPKNHG